MQRPPGIRANSVIRILLLALIISSAILVIGCKNDRFGEVWKMGFRGDYEGILETHLIASQGKRTVYSTDRPGKISTMSDLWLQDECIEVLEAFATDDAAKSLFAIAEQNAASDDSYYNSFPILAAIRTEKRFVAAKLFELCDSESAPLRYAGAAGLGEIGSQDLDRSISKLCKMTDDNEATVRIQAIKSLGQMGARDIDLGHEVLDCILSHATESNVGVRSSVAVALGSLGIPDTFGIVEGMLEDSSYQVRGAAIEALGSFAEDRALPHLKALARTKNVTLRCAVVRALARFSSPDAADILVALVDDPEGHVPQPDGSLLEILAIEVSPVDPLIDGVLMKLLRDPAASVRSQAILTLGDSRPEESRKTVKSMLSDPDPDVRKEGVQALNTAIFSNDELAQLLSVAARDTDIGPRIEAAMKLRKISVDGADEILVKLARDSNLYVRRQAYRALFKHNPDALRKIVLQ
ncbi:MAG: HEAT repeat domain-containing protein [Candidatus Coatesbacteria bacterium]|nr:HEAT repeat domain-containing protein [Candidatus Coatesbacteria bacterium]